MEDKIKAIEQERELRKRDRILEAVKAERERQISLGMDAEFDAENSVNDWVAYIIGYVGRACDIDMNRNVLDCQNFKENMIKVAALAVAAIEAYTKQGE